MTRTLIAVLAVLALVIPLALAQAAEDKQPSAFLSPEDVVRIQMEALGNNDEPYANRGIEISFRFASPGNKRFTGPIDRFIAMVHGPVFAPMLNHKSAEYENLRVVGGRAQVDVVLLIEDDRYVGYRFGLSRQDEPSCDACWMTDSVVPFEVTGT